MSDKEKHRLADKRYYEKNREKEIAKNKDYYRKHKEKVRLYQNEQNKKKMRELRVLIGNKCFICDSDKHIMFHQKYGINHEYRGSNGYRYYLEHYEDFIPLCYLCHKLTHGLKRNMDKAKLEYVVSLFI